MPSILQIVTDFAISAYFFGVAVWSKDITKRERRFHIVMGLLALALLAIVYLDKRAG